MNDTPPPTRDPIPVPAPASAPTPVPALKPDISGAQDTSANTSSAALIKWLWRGYLHKYVWLLLLALLFMAFEGATMGALSWMMRPMFDTVFVAGNSDALGWVGGAIMGIFVIRALASVGQKVVLSYISQNTAANIRTSLLSHLMIQDGSFHQAHPPGFLIQRVQSDVQAVNDVWNAIITGAGRDLIALVILLGVAISVDLQWTLVAIIGAPVLVAPSLLVQRFVRARAREARDIGARLAIRLDEVFHGIVPVKLNRLEGYQANQYRKLTEKLVRAEVRAMFGASTIPGLIDIMAGLGFLGVLIYGGGEIISGEKTVGEFMSFFTAIGFAFEPMRRLGAISGVWQIAAAGIERIKELLETQPTLLSPTSPVSAPKGPPDITLQNVHLAYGTAQVLRGASLVAEAGKTTALVGASGAGKSTIFNLLTRLVDPTSGAVTIGDTQTADMSLYDLRGLFSVVSQDALLFDETLRENILLGRKDVSIDRLNTVLKAAHVSDFLAKLPEGLDSPVGPRGSNLSGGQRQRVAIARALLRDTPVLLLDEATSALDAKSESVVQEALDKLSKGRTTIVIAHRLSTVREADKIVVMDKGRVVDQGTHDDLLARGGIYAQLYALQFKTNEPSGDMIAQAHADQSRKNTASGSKGSAPHAGTNLFSRIARRWFSR